MLRVAFLSKHDSNADGNNGGRHDTGRATYGGSRAGTGQEGAIVPLDQRNAIAKGNLLVGAPIIWKWNAKEMDQSNVDTAKISTQQ